LEQFPPGERWWPIVGSESPRETFRAFDGTGNATLAAFPFRIVSDA
jgi:hypothetical protein